MCGCEKPARLLIKSEHALRNTMTLGEFPDILEKSQAKTWSTSVNVHIKPSCHVQPISKAHSPVESHQVEAEVEDP